MIIALKRKVPLRTHDLVSLYQEINELIILPKELIDRLPEVSQYYVSARYPNAGLEVPSERINKAQAERALEVAEAVVSIANKALGVA